MKPNCADAERQCESSAGLIVRQIKAAKDAEHWHSTALHRSPGANVVCSLEFS